METSGVVIKPRVVVLKGEVTFRRVPNVGIWISASGSSGSPIRIRRVTTFGPDPAGRVRCEAVAIENNSI